MTLLPHRKHRVFASIARKVAISPLLVAMTTVSVTPLTLSQTAHAETAISMDFSELVKQVSPAIARVNVVKSIDSNAMLDQQVPELLRRFFGNRLQVPNQPRRALENAYGSAFFISQDGYLLTNHHVVEGADRITITLNDRREYDAKLIGADKRTDVAVLKVEGNNFPALPLGNSDRAEVGEPVLAIGSPFGFDYSASAGIISATSRNLSRENSVPFIQTDVALNPGNSGGPLFNTKGEVIGINSRIFSGTGGYMGLSFSIPIKVANDVAQQIITNGSVQRAYLGIYPQDLDRNLAEAYGFLRPRGALVNQVSEDSAASKAGLKTGDIILTFNNVDIGRAADLINAINQAKPNDKFSVVVQRDGKRRTLSGKLGEVPQDEAPGDNEQSQNEAPMLGLNARELSPQELKQLDTNGVLITDIDPIGLAARSGLRRGDVITGINNRAVNNIAGFAKAVDTLPKQGAVVVNIVRQGSPIVLGLRIE